MFEALHPGLEPNLGSKKPSLGGSMAFQGSRPCEGGEAFMWTGTKSDYFPQTTHSCWSILPAFNGKEKAASVHAHLAWQVQSLPTSIHLARTFTYSGCRGMTMIWSTKKK